MFKLKSAIVLLSTLTALGLSFHLYAASQTGNTETTSQFVEGSATTGNIKTQLLADPDISSFDISVTTEKGVVTLTGIVDTEAQKAKAESIAKGADGVTSVDNQLTVQPKVK
jgi:hyperosmotically inducible protein